MADFCDSSDSERGEFPETDLYHGSDSEREESPEVDLYNGSDVKRETYREVLFPMEFKDIHPDGKSPPVPLDWNQLSLPITHLSHITHEKEASSIAENRTYYSFHPKIKFGKHPIGKSYKFKKIDTMKYKYEIITKDDQVFPGFLSWWGISFRNWYKESDERTFLTILKDIRKIYGKHVYEAGYLREPPDSRYGNKEFIFSWNDLIQFYKESHTSFEGQSVYLKKAGTLRYRFEICYVVMIVMQEDLQNDDIKSMPSFCEEESIFEHNGCIDKEGKLIGDDVPSFRIKHPFTWIKGERNISWESLVFAFYFADDTTMFQCEKRLGKCLKVKHTKCTVRGQECSSLTK